MFRDVQCLQKMSTSPQITEICLQNFMGYLWLKLILNEKA